MRTRWIPWALLAILVLGVIAWHLNRRAAYLAGFSAGRNGDEPDPSAAKYVQWGWFDGRSEQRPAFA